MILSLIKKLYYISRRFIFHRLFLISAKSDFGNKKNFSKYFSHLIETRISDFHRTVSWGDRLLTLDKAQNFNEDYRFKKAFEEIKGSHIYDQYDGNDTIVWRLNTLVWAARCSLKLDGDFIECGTFKGDMAWVIINSINFQEKRDREFYLYDSFEGFSRKYSFVNDFPDSPGFFDYAEKFYKKPGLYDSVIKRFDKIDNVHVVKGFLPDSLDSNTHDKIAFLHLDLNSPGPEIAVLEMLFDRVVLGGTIVLDDFGWILHKKQLEAEITFFEKRNQVVLELPTGQGLVIKR